MKKLSVLLLLSLLFITSCKPPAADYTSKKEPCVIVEVIEYSPGEKHTLQTDYEYQITTDCGHTFTSHKSVQLGDTIWVEYRTFVK